MDRWMKLWLAIVVLSMVGVVLFTVGDRMLGVCSAHVEATEPADSVVADTTPAGTNASVRDRVCVVVGPGEVAIATDEGITKMTLAEHEALKAKEESESSAAKEL
jgi:hypothetical protein